MAIKFVDRVPTRPGRIKITPEDGSDVWYGVMERADEPSVEGTPINAANLNAMQQNQGMSGNMTIYVATSGSDSLGDGSSTAPYSTITKALSMIPKVLNGYIATVNIAAGVYNEDITVSGFGGGEVLFTGDNGINVSINTLTVSRGTIMRTSNINLTITGIITNQSLYISNRASLISGSGSINISSTAENGISLINGGFAYIGSATINNVTANGVLCSGKSSCYINVLNINTKGRGIRATAGSDVGFASSTIVAGAQYSTEYGGRIYSGAQTSIPNY